MRQAHVKNVAFYWCVFFLIAALSQNRHTYATRAFRHAEKSGLKQTCNYKSAAHMSRAMSREDSKDRWCVWWRFPLSSFHKPPLGTLKMQTIHLLNNLSSPLQERGWRTDRIDLGIRGCDSMFSMVLGAFKNTTIYYLIRPTDRSRKTEQQQSWVKVFFMAG